MRQGARTFVYNRRGSTYVQRAPDLGHTRDLLGAVRYANRRLAWSQRLTSADPGTRLASPVTDTGEGNGIVFPLTGGWGSSDWCGAYPYGLWSFDDIFGRPLGGTDCFSFSVFIYARGTPWVSADECVVIAGVVNETDLTTATVDGMALGLIGTGVTGFLAASRHSTTNGAASTLAGTGTSGVVGATMAVSYQGIGSTAFVAHCVTTGLDSTGARVTGSGSATAANSTWGANPSRFYLVVGAGRTSAGAAGALSPAFDVYISPTLRHPLQAP